MKTPSQRIKGAVFFIIAVFMTLINPPGSQADSLFLPIVLRNFMFKGQSEGFEGGVVPPAGWTRVQNNTRETWKIADISPYAGNYLANIEFDDQIEQQNEVLLSPSFQSQSARLDFYSFGSLYWCRDTYDNCDLNVWLVIGDWDGGTGDDIFLRTADQDWKQNPNDPDGFSTWSLTSINLTPTLQSLPNGTPVRIGFQYKGKDGAEAGLDNIRLQ